MSKSQSSGGFWSRFFSMLSFIALISLGIAITLAFIFRNVGDGSVTSAFNVIAHILAFTVVAFYSFFFANRQRGNARIWCLVFWAIALVLLIVFYILGIL